MLHHCFLILPDLKILPLVFIFQQFDYEMSSMNFSEFIIFGLFYLLDPVSLFFPPKFEFFNLFTSCMFSTLHFFSSSSATQVLCWQNYLTVLILSHRLLRLCSFFFPAIFFSLVFRLDNFFWFIFKFTAFFSVTPLSPSNEIFVSVIVLVLNFPCGPL